MANITMKMKCFNHSGNHGCSHELEAAIGEPWHTYMDGQRYFLRYRTDKIVELIPDGVIHVGEIVDNRG